MDRHGDRDVGAAGSIKRVGTDAGRIAADSEHRGRPARDGHDCRSASGHYTGRSLSLGSCCRCSGTVGRRSELPYRAQIDLPRAQGRNRIYAAKVVALEIGRAHV